MILAKLPRPDTSVAQLHLLQFADCAPDAGGSRVVGLMASGAAVTGGNTAGAAKSSHALCWTAPKKYAQSIDVAWFSIGTILLTSLLALDWNHHPV